MTVPTQRKLENKCERLITQQLRVVLAERHAARVQDMAIYSIGDVASRFGLTNRTLRFYEQQGLLKPLRTGKHRIYSDDDLQKLEVILQASAVGIGIGEIAQVIRRSEEGSSVWKLDVVPSAAAALLNAARLRQQHLRAGIAQLEKLVR